MTTYLPGEHSAWDDAYERFCRLTAEAPLSPLNLGRCQPLNAKQRTYAAFAGGGGIEVLKPIQVSAANMDLAVRKREYGKNLVFSARSTTTRS